MNSYLLTNATGDVICGDPSLGEVATSVGAYTAFLNATLREFEGRSMLPHLYESSRIKLLEVNVQLNSAFGLLLAAQASVRLPACHQSSLQSLSAVLLRVTLHGMHDVKPWIPISQLENYIVHADGKPPLVNVTSLNISHIDYGRHGLENKGASCVYSISTRVMQWSNAGDVGIPQ